MLKLKGKTTGHERWARLCSMFDYKPIRIVPKPPTLVVSYGSKAWTFSFSTFEEYWQIELYLLDASETAYGGEYADYYSN